MSNVLARERGISEMEFYRNAALLHRELCAFLMNDKNVPKKWRSIYAYPIINMMEAMFDLMEDANNIYPYTEGKVEERKELQQKCVGYCFKIYGKLQRAAIVIWWSKLHADEDNSERIRIENHLNDIGEMLDREITLLSGWRRGTKLLHRK